MQYSRLVGLCLGSNWWRYHCVARILFRPCMWTFIGRMNLFGFVLYECYLLFWSKSIFGSLLTYDVGPIFVSRAHSIRLSFFALANSAIQSAKARVSLTGVFQTAYKRLMTNNLLFKSFGSLWSTCVLVVLTRCYLRARFAWGSDGTCTQVAEFVQKYAAAGIVISGSAASLLGANWGMW